ncbi:1,4-dihydroxy-2-naphthoate octaprenyltransferase [Fibrobacter sp.]|uniref:1,4-dihydroxy-2-naphthoate octaprenyltransferase n=1 Tax=Fibrobacter sp. TaxID=35828 RepID=UPI00388D4566
MPKINSPKAWLLAARPKTLTGAMIPVMLAGSLAFYNDSFKPSLWICCAAFACLMQIAANFINDIYDFLKGTDRKDRLGPERACAQGWITPKAMKIGIFIDVSIACAFGLLAVTLSWETLPYHGFEFIVLGAVCVIFAFLYTIGLSYLGLGDILVLVFFGFVPVCGTYYLQALTIDAGALIISVISGIAIDALLVINNYRDRDQDKISGKKTIIVRFGEPFGRFYYLAIGIVVTALIFSLFSTVRYFVLIPAIIYLTLHIKTWREMVKIFKGRALNVILGKTSRNMFIMALLLSAAIVAAKMAMTHFNF